MAKRKGKKGKRGLALLPVERRKEIARQGGKASQRLRRGHRWSPEEAKAQRAEQLARKRAEEDLYLRMRTRLRAALGPSPTGRGEAAGGAMREAVETIVKKGDR